MVKNMNLLLDDGFQFGIGLFETICIKDKKPILLDWHLERINNSLKEFGINQTITRDEVLQWLTEHENEMKSLQALKLIVSEKNKLFLFRDNPYTDEIISKGFHLDYSQVLRNETSMFTYHKSMNYGDNITEKRRTKNSDIDEVIFLNSKGQITEGSTTNVFFIKDNVIYTPKRACGLLPGVLRRYIIEHFECEETVIYPQDIQDMDECFVTNSLMGVMTVTDLAGKHFETDCIGKQIQARYLGDCSL